VCCRSKPGEVEAAYADYMRQLPARSGRSRSPSNLNIQGLVRPRSMAGLRRANCRWHCLDPATTGHSRLGLESSTPINKRRYVLQPTAAAFTQADSLHCGHSRPNGQGIDSYEPAPPKEAQTLGTRLRDALYFTIVMMLGAVDAISCRVTAASARCRRAEWAAVTHRFAIIERTFRGLAR
jgi:hypothetical protein